MHNSDKHGSCYIAGALYVGFDESTDTHYALADEPAGIARCCKNIQQDIDTFDMMRGFEEDTSAAVDCRHDSTAK